MGAVTVFEHYNCYGQSNRFYWNPNDPDGGQYFKGDIYRSGLRNDVVSSLVVPRGYTVVLYNGYGFDGETQRFYGKYQNDATQELQCVNVHGKHNDKLSSLRVLKQPSAIGYWQGITSTESQDYSFHVGINYETTQGSSTEIQTSLTVGMEAGFDFMGGSGSVSVEASVSKTL